LLLHGYFFGKNCPVWAIVIAVRTLSIKEFFVSVLNESVVAEIEKLQKSVAVVVGDCNVDTPMASGCNALCILTCGGACGGNCEGSCQKHAR
jgi:hypothetical protein